MTPWCNRELTVTHGTTQQRTAAATTAAAVTRDHSQLSSFAYTSTDIIMRLAGAHILLRKRRMRSRNALFGPHRPAGFFRFRRPVHKPSVAPVLLP